MLDALGKNRRTHHCCQLNTNNVGERVVLMGWVQQCRNFGDLIFVDLRDREGITQVVFNSEINPCIHTKAKQFIKNEFIIGVVGVVNPRPEGMTNEKLFTGQIEVSVDELMILSSAKPPIFNIEDNTKAFEDTRLEYRYIDLKRPKLQKNIINRHKASSSIRNFLNSEGFLDIETPMLTKSTPEGARDYLVPSRINQGKFYALPQSPQIFKQLLMLSGFDKYYQIVRCFRDEDLRSDRQPEFTQVDLEMSFVGRNDIMILSENMIKNTFKDTLGVNIKHSFLKLKYEEAINRFGLDKPDVRFGLELVDLSDVVKNSDFKLFSRAVKKGGVVKAINLKGYANISRSKIDDFTEVAKLNQAKGLAWVKVRDNSWQSPIAKYFKKTDKASIVSRTKAEPGDLILFVADTYKVVNESLGNLRNHIGDKLGLIDKDVLGFVWITDFPMFQYNEINNRYQAVHHPFTLPIEEDLHKISSDPLSVKSKAYDLVLNGFEIGGGSIRIHDVNLQKEVFELLGMKRKDYESKFGFLLKALEFGAPPHGGIAFGFDRLVMLICRELSIRETIAFPKTLRAVCLLSNAPSQVESKQLDELLLQSNVASIVES